MTLQTGDQTIAEAEFYGYLARELDSDRDVGSDTRLMEDMGLDSLRTLEILLVVEDLGVELADEDVPGWRTCGDVYRSYRRAARVGVDG